MINKRRDMFERNINFRKQIGLVFVYGYRKCHEINFGKTKEAIKTPTK